MKKKNEQNQKEIYSVIVGIFARFLLFCFEFAVAGIVGAWSGARWGGSWREIRGGVRGWYWRLLGLAALGPKLLGFSVENLVSGLLGFGPRFSLLGCFTICKAWTIWADYNNNNLISLMIRKD